MSDYDKICTVEEMINNQHNVISERIRQLEAKVAAMKFEHEKMMTTIDEINRTIKTMNTVLNDSSNTETKRYDTISSQIKNITDQLRSIDHHAKLASERSGKT